MYKFSCDLCRKEMDYFAFLNPRAHLTYTRFEFFDIRICPECGKSFEEWMETRKKLRNES